MPSPKQFKDIPRIDSLKEGFGGADIVMALRMQFERMEDSERGSSQGFFETYGVTHETMQYAKPNARVMHPGPMNRGVEICGRLADDADRSLILRQVFYGVATRMACLDALLTRGE
ncbi:MAG: hypothetical protein R3C58_00210 [Parvularculaceae bacterium]